MSYKIDFSPFISAIIKYYLTIIALFIFTVFLYRFIALCEQGEISVKQISLPQAIWQYYKSINPLYRHTFWIVFVACNIVFGFHTIHFLWGNHDWGAVLDRNPFFTGTSQGRYTQSIIGEFLQGEQMLPILNNVLAFVGLAVAAVWLCIYLNIQKNLWIWVIVGFVLTLQPFTLAKMYYSYQIVGDFFAIMIGILGFVLAKKAGESSESNANTANLARNGGGQTLCRGGGGTPLLLNHANPARI